MDADAGGKKADDIKAGSILEHDEISDINATIDQDKILNLLAAILVDDMIRLEQEFGWTPIMIAEYYAGSRGLPDKGEN